MGNISDLSDELLVTILLLIPGKDAVATSLLSRRWRFVWRALPKLEYNDSSSATASQFITNFLQLNNAPCLETLHLKLERDYAPEDYEKWVNIAVARNVRDLALLRILCHLSPIPVPKSLYTHETLVVLSLRQMIIEEIPSTNCFRCLKSLSLFVRFSSDETVERLLSCCPVLETLFVEPWGSVNVKKFLICVPSLQRLEIKYLNGGYHEPRKDHGFVINTPSLKSLNIDDHYSGFYSLVNIPKQVEVNIQLRHCDSEELLGSLTSAKSLSLCLNPQMVKSLFKCPKGNFDQLVSLELCVHCSLDWLNFILGHSPRLRALTFNLLRGYGCWNSKNVRTKWEQPSCAPECLLLSLETVEWIAYKGTEEEKFVVMYLLENGNFLKTVRICFSVSTTVEEKNRMKMKLEAMPRSSSKCKLSFTQVS